MSLVTRHSPHGVRESVDRLITALDARGITVFARIDHGGGARAAGLALADEELLLFGDPRVGTLLMQSDPSVGYELPLRILVWDEGGTTTIGYRSPVDLGDSHALAGHDDVLHAMTGLLADLSSEACAP